MNGFLEVIHSLSSKYRLPVSTVKDALDQVLIGPEFKHATKSVFGELTEEGVVLFCDDGFRLLGEPEHSLSRLLTAELERILTDQTTAGELDQWGLLAKQVIRARIDRIDEEGTMEVIVERTGLFGETSAEIVAYCHLRNQSTWDRKTLRPGEYRYFHVQKVQALRHGTAPASITIELSRRTPRLTEFLVKKALKGEQRFVKCWKREAGKVSFVRSDSFIPPAAIEEARRELGEWIKVEYPKRDTDRDRKKS